MKLFGLRHDRAKKLLKKFVAYIALSSFIVHGFTPLAAKPHLEVPHVAARGPGIHAVVKTSVYVGNSPADLAAAEKWLGRDVDATQAFVGQASWSDWMGSMPWIANLFKGSNVDILWSLPLIPQGATLQAAASGTYDDKYLQMAKQFVAASTNDPQIYVRVGWEMNGNWFPWAAANDPDAYVGAFRHLVDAFRSVSDKFVFEWTPNLGDMGMNPELAYPGDDYVDVIGMDFYYNTAWDSRDPKVAWNYFVTEKYGLQWHQDFAAEHGKPTAYAEWGLNSDSPEYVKMAEKWFEDHNVLYQNYWNSNADFFGKLSSGQYQNAGNTFKDIFGSDTYTGAVTVLSFKDLTDAGLTYLSTAANHILGTAGADVLTGSSGDDFFMLAGGGKDVANGGTGSDAFYFRASLDTSDAIDGGTGTDDQLALQGNYAGYVFGDKNLVGIETLSILSGHIANFGDTGGRDYSYGLTTRDANVAPTGLLTVNANTLGVNENLTFNGAAETDGSFMFYAGKGVDKLTGGAQSDTFFFGDGHRFTATDRVDGGVGYDDQLGLRGDYRDQVVFTATTMQNIETLVLMSAADTRFGGDGVGFGYNLKLADGNVAAGATLIISANNLGISENTTIDGSAETNGAYKFVMGAGDDVVIGGSGNDQFYGRGGHDTMTGGGGADSFYFRSLGDSTVSAPDVITDFAHGDHIDLSVIDAATGSKDDAFRFIGNAAFSHHAGELMVTGSGNHWLVQGDVDGNGIADFAIAVTTVANQMPAAGDFIL